MRRALMLALALALLPGGLAAFEGATYLRQVVTAKAAGLGGCFASAEGDVEASWYNPAGLAGVGGTQCLFTHMTWVGDITTDHLAVAMPFKETQAIGFSLTRDAAKDTYRDEWGNEGGEFSISELVAGVFYASQADLFSWGMGLKALQENIELQGAAGLVGDLGVVGHFMEQRFAAGASLQNIGWVPNVGGGPAPVAPMTLRAGVTERAAAGLLVMQEYRVALGNPSGTLGLGGQYRIRAGVADLLCRLGYDFQEAVLGGASGLGVGLGIRYEDLSLDYAYSPMEYAGAGHRFTLKYVLSK